MKLCTCFPPGANLGSGPVLGVRVCRVPASALAVAAVADAHGAMFVAMRPDRTVHNGVEMLHSPPLLLMTPASDTNERRTLRATNGESDKQAGDVRRATGGERRATNDESDTNERRATITTNSESDESDERHKRAANSEIDERRERRASGRAGDERQAAKDELLHTNRATTRPHSNQTVLHSTNYHTFPKLMPTLSHFPALSLYIPLSYALAASFSLVPCFHLSALPVTFSRQPV